MDIKAKFNINDLLRAKYDSTHKGQIVLLEAMFVMTETCSAGTQVFYICRAIILLKEYKNEFRKKGSYVWNIAHGVNNDKDNSTGYRKYREDEIIGASSYLLDIVNGIVTKGDDSVIDNDED